ncbi:unnamed protein product, partial [Didymodactylos carnosus]
MKNLLKFAICDAPFRFYDEIFIQREEVAMGDVLGPILAELFMQKEDEKIHNWTGIKPVLYKRYVDDIFCVFNEDQDVDMFFNYLNTQLHSNLRFTVKNERNDQLNYLDVLVIRKISEKKYETTIYRKPMDTGLYMLYESNQCRIYKLGLIRTLAIRILRICSSNEFVKIELKKLRQLMIINGYPNNVIRRAIKEAEIIVHRLMTNRLRPNPPVKMKSVFFTLPYYGRETLILGQRIKKLARQLMPTVDMKMAYRKTLTLQNVFLPLQKGLDITEKEKNLVYFIPCMDCDY